MTTLRVVVDPLIASTPDAISRYSAELTRAIIATTPADCDVVGIVSSIGGDDEARLLQAFPGLSGIQQTQLASRELTLAWQFGVVGGMSGLVHSPSLLAPLRRHDRADGDQVTVTVHDLFAWTSPASLNPTAVAWNKAMLKRARKYADAVVVQSHALAAELSEIADFGERIRVIPGGPRSDLSVPQDAEERAERLALPDRYIVTEGSLDEREGIEALAAGLAAAGVDVPLYVIGARLPDALPDEGPRAIRSANVRLLGELDAADRAVLLSRAAAFVFPTTDDGFGAPLLEAMRLGVPSIHSDAPALVELTSGAGLVVERSDPGAYPEALAEAVNRLLGDPALAGRLRIAGIDRSRAFGWSDAGARIWQLHAEL